MTDSQFCIGRVTRNDDVSSAYGQGARKASSHRSCGEKSEEMRLHRKVVVRFATALAASMALLLGGCCTDSTFGFKADGSIRTEIIVEDETGSMWELKGSCDELRTVASTTRKLLAEGKIGNITPPNGNLTCRITSKVTPDSVKFGERSNSYTIILSTSNVRKSDLDTVTARTIIIMPGKVIKANVGSVSGNKVRINRIDHIAGGFTITSRKGSSANPAADTPTTTATSSGRRVARDDSLLWVWTSVGCAALAALILGGLAALRTARKRRQHSAV